jgi:hypothetical protein
MWLFEKRGFHSLVAYDPKQDRSKDSKFRTIAKRRGTHLLVRARIKEDFDWLKPYVPDLVVETDASADYAYRAVISRRAYKKALCAAIDAIDYDSHFKEAARDNSPKAKGRYEAMMSVWTAMSKLQAIAPWSGLASTRSRGQSAFARDDFAAFDFDKYADDFDDDDDEFSDEEAATYRRGHGPKHGLSKGEQVLGYKGLGEVVAVDSGKGTDRVRVMWATGGTTTVLSNYLERASV